MSVLPRASSRDIRLDTVRGALLVIMAINHIDSDLRVLTDQVWGFVTAAEGFVFLSGLVAGLVYTRKLRRLGSGQVRALAFRRTGQIYRAHVFAYLAIFVWSLSYEWVTGRVSELLPALFFERPWAALLAGPLLFYQPGLLDILPMYCGFMLLLPWLLQAFEQGSKAQCLLLSLSLWAISPWLSLEQALVVSTFNPGSFSLLAWQWLFVAGAALGHSSATRPGPLVPANPALVVAALLGVVTLWLVRHGWWSGPWTGEQVIAWTMKYWIAPLRMINFALLAYLLASVGTVFPRLLELRPLALLGRHALAVFAGHTVIVAIILTFPSFSVTTAGRWGATGLLLTGLFAIASFAESRRLQTTSPCGAPARPIGGRQFVPCPAPQR